MASSLMRYSKERTNSKTMAKTNPTSDASFNVLSS